MRIMINFFHNGGGDPNHVSVWSLKRWPSLNVEPVEKITNGDRSRNRTLWLMQDVTPLPSSRSNGSTVLEAQSRFVVRGGRWKPTPDIEAQIRAAALGKQKCPVLKIPRS